MAQVPKEHVRRRIVAAAAHLFAARGYAATTVASVAARAGTSTGNVYKYFAGKEALFDAVLPEAFARDVRRLTHARIVALGSARDVRELPRDARYHVVAGELLERCLAERERVVILLARAEGTRFARFAEDFGRALVSWALGYARRAWPEVPRSPALGFALSAVYRGYLRSLAEALMSLPSRPRAQAAIELLTTHHQGGLAQLFASLARGPAPRELAP
ncbi:MAG: TetR/AcrR family transcriptional regulator [Polyangiaceae bacterium]|nr:TetR/AcrR family transcriptional regulator [Polyangiaceae bacterium]